MRIAHYTFEGHHYQLDVNMPEGHHLFLDHSYTDLIREGGQAICRLIDPHGQIEVREQFGPEFPELVVLAPSDRSTVSFEPYSCVTNAINLVAHRTDTGLVILQPGDRWHGKVEFSVAPITSSHTGSN